MKPLLLPLLGICILTPGLYAKKTHSERTEAMSPEEELRSFKVPEGFVVELVASEADGVVNPIDLAFDDAGRLWTQTARMYPLDPVKNIKWNDLLKLMDDPEAQKQNPEFKRVLDLYQGNTKGEDQVLVLSGIYGKGKPKTSIFADGLAIPQSILPYGNGAYVAQGSELFYLEDTNSDGKADKRTPILTGFGFTDTHTMTHTMVRAPGGWIHFSQGALNKGEATAVKSGMKARFDYSKIGRFSTDGNKVEVVSSGLNNIWGFWMRSNGQWWGCEANDMGWSITSMEPGTGFTGIGNDRIRPYQPEFPRLHQFRVGGTGISGLAYADDEAGSFPDEWKDVAFLANPITNKINAVNIKRNEDGTVTAKHLPDFLTTEDDWFRPVNIEFGPDGCLYIADWYNKIVSHNEVPTGHPDRDKSHGRIWRVRYIGAPTRNIPDLYQAKAEDLVSHLSAPSIWEKRSAVNQITERGLKQLAPALIKLVSDEKATEVSRIHALWALEGIGHYEANTMNELLNSKLPDLRREVVRSLAKLAPDLDVFNKALARLMEDPNPMVRSQVLRTIAERGEANTETIDIIVTACKPEITGAALGGPYERKFERFLARMALEKFPSELSKYFLSPLAKNQSGSNMLWASQALPVVERNKAFLSIWEDRDKKAQLDESTFVMFAGMLDAPEILKEVGPTLQNTEHGASYVAFALKNQAQIQSPNLSKVLVPVVEQMLGISKSRMMALDAIARMNVPVSSDSITRLLEGTQSAELVNKVLKALQADAKKNREAIFQLASNESLAFNTRLSALHSLTQISPQDGNKILQPWLKTMSDDEKRGLTNEFSGSKQGSAILIQEHISGQLSIESFDIASAERINQLIKKNADATKILNQVRTIDAEKKKELANRISHLMKVPDQFRGDPAKGKVMFNTCLLCHRVGEQGFDIAPALDGSANREREALLTAILDPDAAVEGGYRTYRVTKKDDTTLEGYLTKDDDSGVTLSFMGGAAVFVPVAEIASKGFVGGRSFMQKGLLDNYSDQEVADLLSFIQTLK
jgi:putative heme-binding domain-containing protein